MKLAIIEKLRAVLDVGVDSECKVVYVLAETRKLLETYPPAPFPFALKLYCHWALHIDLENPKVTLPFLEGVETFVVSYLAGNSDIAAERRLLREFVLLNTFRLQFRQFLQAYDLPTALCDENSRWHEFVKHYAGVIEDGSLSCNAKTNALKLVSEVIFSRGTAAMPGSYIPFGLEWTIILTDGRKLTVEVKVEPFEGKEMISHSTTLR
jgi:hypothetical protein